MKIVALDQATAVTGVAVFEDSTLKECFYIKHKRGTKVDNHLVCMTEYIFQVLEERQPDVVIIEGTTFQRSAGTTIMLSELRGAIIGWCIGRDVQLVSYMPSSWRKMLGFKQGRGIQRKDVKKQAKDYVLSHYGLEVTEDEADAVCIGSAYGIANGLINAIEQMGTFDKDGNFIVNMDGGI